jgi:protein TonB
MKSVAAAVVVAALFGAAHARGIYQGRDDVVAPVVIRQVSPEYTAEARAARIEGVADVEVVVQTDGSVRDATIVKSLDSVHGLDRQAVKAATEWRFKPATRNGKPVPVSVTLQMKFTLK